jgi:hypothetical protein
MPTFEVAHIREQGVDLIIVPLAREFGWKSADQQDSIVSTLQARASVAGLAGHVVPVWDAGSSRMAFRAPRNWHRFFRSISLRFVHLNLNRRLSW